MFNWRPLVVFPVLATVVVTTASPLNASADRAIETVQKATQLFNSEMSSPKTRIPAYVLRNAVGIAIVPNVVKAGFIVGGTRGTGVLSVREANGRWSNPAFVNLTAGSIGLQIGAQSSDVIIVFNSRESIQKALTQDLNIGGSVSANAGPDGATPVSNTSTVPDVYTYVRNQEGLFAGVSLQGAKMGTESGRNQDFYNRKDITPQEILTTSPPAPPVAQELRAVLNRYAPPK